MSSLRQKDHRVAGSQAYRRPVTDADLEGLLGFYQSGRNEGDFETGIRTAIQAILASPEFVFRFSSSRECRAGHQFPYFGYGARFAPVVLPRTQLSRRSTHHAGQSGQVEGPVVLERQVRRMLADPRSEAFVTYLRRPAAASAESKGFDDLTTYPEFDNSLSNSMRTETEMLFASVMRQDRNFLDLLTANYTFVNERLPCEHYGIPNVSGEDSLRDAHRSQPFWFIGHRAAF